jgi:radical SAM-linked protein
MEPHRNPASADGRVSAPDSPAAARVVPAEARQRWRLTFSRRGDAPPLPQREQLGAWEASLSVSGLPLMGLDAPVPRPRLVFGAPLAIGTSAERDLVDFFLAERRGIAEVRVRLAGSLPSGHEIVDLHDVWLGEPALTGQVVAADYRVELAGGDGTAAPDPTAMSAACARLLASASLPRSRDKGGRSIEYDLRPLVADVRVGTDDGAILVIRTRFDHERGVGRPEEVVTALSELAGVALTVRRIVRERLLLAGDE